MLIFNFGPFYTQESTHWGGHMDDDNYTKNGLTPTKEMFPISASWYPKTGTMVLSDLKVPVKWLSPLSKGNILPPNPEDVNWPERERGLSFKSRSRHRWHLWWLPDCCLGFRWCRSGYLPKGSVPNWSIEPAHKLKIDQNKLQNCRSNILNLVNVLWKIG